MKTRPSRPSPRIRGASGASGGGIRSRRIRPGSSPGTVVFVGEQRLAKLAASAYATTVEPSQFRAGLFFHCVVPGNPPR